MHFYNVKWVSVQSLSLKLVPRCKYGEGEKESAIEIEREETTRYHCFQVSSCPSLSSTVCFHEKTVHTRNTTTIPSNTLVWHKPNPSDQLIFSSIKKQLPDSLIQYAPASANTEVSHAAVVP